MPLPPCTKLLADKSRRRSLSCRFIHPLDNALGDAVHEVHDIGFSSLGALETGQQTGQAAIDLGGQAEGSIALVNDPERLGPRQLSGCWLWTEDPRGRTSREGVIGGIF